MKINSLTYLLALAGFVPASSVSSFRGLKNSSSFGSKSSILVSSEIQGLSNTNAFDDSERSLKTNRKSKSASKNGPSSSSLKNSAGLNSESNTKKLSKISAAAYSSKLSESSSVHLKSGGSKTSKAILSSMNDSTKTLSFTTTSVSGNSSSKVGSNNATKSSKVSYTEVTSKSIKSTKVVSSTTNKSSKISSTKAPSTTTTKSNKIGSTKAPTTTTKSNKTGSTKAPSTISKSTKSPSLAGKSSKTSFTKSPSTDGKSNKSDSYPTYPPTSLTTILLTKQPTAGFETLSPTSLTTTSQPTSILSARPSFTNVSTQTPSILSTFPLQPSDKGQTVSNSPSQTDKTSRSTDTLTFHFRVDFSGNVLLSDTVSNDGPYQKDIIHALQIIGESKHEMSQGKRILKDNMDNVIVSTNVQSVSINEASSVTCPSLLPRRRRIQEENISSCVVFTCSVTANTESSGTMLDSTKMSQDAIENLNSKYENSMSPKGISFLAAMDNLEISNVTYIGRGKYQYSKIVGENESDSLNWILPVAISGASLLCCFAGWGAYRRSRKKENINDHQAFHDEIEGLSIHDQIQHEVKSEGRRTSHAGSSIVGDI